MTDTSERRRAESLLMMQNHALEQLATGRMLHEVLDVIACGVERQVPGARCSVLLVQDHRLRPGAAPHLPTEYVAAIDGLAIGPGVGSCGHAAYTGRPIVVADIATHEHWEGGRRVALSHGLRSCWSTPILSRSREVLGVFAVYHDRPYEPGPSDLGVIEAATHIAGIAIERHRSDQALLDRNQELLDVDRRKDVFLAMLAHELRNPLAPLRTAQHLLKSCADDPAAVRRLHEVIERQTAQLSRLVDDLLDVSRITRGAIELRKQRVTAQSLVSAALETMRSRLVERHHQVHVGLPEQPAWVEADPLRMSQVLANLIDNAAKYTEPGGEIFISLGVAGAEAVVTVRDTGIGMEPETLKKAFQLFMQADSSLARSQGGLGIGLTLVRSLVEMHGGRVSASSPGLGLGSEFEVHLPLARELTRPAEPGQHKGPAGAGTSRARRKRVLIIDDNCDAAETMELALAESGYDVLVAYDGLHGLSAAESFLPDVALVDIGLPAMDGYEVARQLRAGLPPERLRLIAVTGYGQDSDRRRALEAGFDRHLVKPVDIDTILRELAEP